VDLHLPAASSDQHVDWTAPADRTAMWVPRTGRTHRGLPCALRSPL